MNHASALGSSAILTVFFILSLSREIVVERNDDDGISTLGEPMVFPGGMQHMMQSDEPTAT